MDAKDEWTSPPNCDFYPQKREYSPSRCSRYSIFHLHDGIEFPLLPTSERLISKHGAPNITNRNIPNQGKRYFQDIFTTIVDMKWRYHLLVFALGFLVTWTIFAVLFYLIAVIRDDINHVDDANWTPCVENIRTFVSAFLFSVESQHTIGYGYRHITEHCPEAITFLCLQSIIGVIIQTLMVGLILTKATRPKARQLTLVFTNKCVVNIRNGKLCLMFRIGDMRKSHIIGATIKVYIMKNTVTEEGESICGYLTPLKLRIDNASDLYLLWPAVIVHEIDEESPFYHMNAKTLNGANFEIFVVMEGSTESTGQAFQARTSYLPKEIAWGERFMGMFEKAPKGYDVNFGLFNRTVNVQTPFSSAAELNKVRESTESLIAETDSTCSLPLDEQRDHMQSIA